MKWGPRAKANHFIKSSMVCKVRERRRPENAAFEKVHRTLRISKILVEKERFRRGQGWSSSPVDEVKRFAAHLEAFVMHARAGVELIGSPWAKNKDVGVGDPIGSKPHPSVILIISLY